MSDKTRRHQSLDQLMLTDVEEVPSRSGQRSSTITQLLEQLDRDKAPGTITEVANVHQPGAWADRIKELTIAGEFTPGFDAYVRRDVLYVKKLREGETIEKRKRTRKSPKSKSSTGTDSK